ncbi:hypothetical protein [Craterilacuibacter sinensis]|uniref:Uncharacterized protein n=1 Tax=Craterilacuibacter sinensis TaxID=2686017 RepID=A0A845BG33_9NEIS|nr:hypothetical protein [Craterilacuibacter sinensis]MXR35707.1 hypothetical protein [Craterilacuibacter sinensis]
MIWLKLFWLLSGLFLLDAGKMSGISPGIACAIAPAFGVESPATEFCQRETK